MTPLSLNVCAILLNRRARYFAAVDQLQQEDPAVQRLVTEVFQLLRPVSALQEEPLRSRVLEQLRKQTVN